MATSSKRTTCSAVVVAGTALGFLDMKAEIGDLEWEVCWSVRFDRHDTDLSRVRYQLFRGRLTDLAGWAGGEVLELRGALDRAARGGGGRRGDPGRRSGGPGSARRLGAARRAGGRSPGGGAGAGRSDVHAQARGP